MNTIIGRLIDGSLSEGLRVKLEPALTGEDLKVGTYVVVTGQNYDYFAIVTDIVLGGVSDDILLMPPENELALDAASGSLYTTVKVAVLLSIDSAGQKRPVKSLPKHFAPLRVAGRRDFARVFGSEDEKHFKIGTPIGMNVPICLDLNRFIERSNGVFGKSGTGKSFLTRMLLSGVIRSDLASAIIFDLHNEYGWSSRNEDRTETKGLKQLFGAKIKVFALDEESAKARSIRPDKYVKIGLNQLEAEDLLLLSDVLNLQPTAAETAYILERNYQERWLAEFLAWDQYTKKERAESLGLNEFSLSSLQRKLGQIEKFSFITKEEDDSAVSEIIALVERGYSIVLDFGKFHSVLPYLLVANVLTRRIYNRYVEMSEEAMAEGGDSKIRPLTIVIEEAHNFLRPEIAKQTIFGKIARELRKYNVTLLVVDQRPSEIDREVLSQLGTRVTALLNDDKDIDAVFTGVAGGQMLRSILSTLDSKEQALILGHAVPLSAVIQTRRYDAKFYEEIAAGNGEVSTKEAKKLLFPEDALA